MEDILYIWLSMIKGVGPVLASNLLAYFCNVERIYRATVEQLINADGIGPKIAENIIKCRNLDRAYKIYDYCQGNNIRILHKYDENYPKQLLQYKNAPLLLYVKGNLKQVDTTVAVVGARKCTEYGKQVTIELAQKIAESKMALISGMAKGIDGYAHTIAIKNSGYTIAVLGTGIDICYPREHSELMSNIIENGAVISQFPPGTTNVRENFIKRNETIAMMSDKVIITQASKESGALHTGYYGMKYNKEVFAVPSSIYDTFNAGANELISKGVKIYTGYQCIIHNMKSSDKIPTKYIIDNKVERQIYELLRLSPSSLDRIKTLLKIDSNKIDEIIFKMEIENEISQVGGVYRVQM